MGLIDNDAAACYNRIITNIAAIACQCLEMPLNAEHLHSSILLHNKYHVKTAHGTSDETYQSNPTDPLQGQGQGSGNAPSTWNAVSAPMWTTLANLTPLSYTTINPRGTNVTTTQGIAFIDDTSNMFNLPFHKKT